MHGQQNMKTESSVSLKGGKFSSKHSFLFGATAPQWTKASSCTRFLEHTQWHTTVGKNPVDGWLAPVRELYLTTFNNHNRHTCPPPGGIRTHNLSRGAATGTCASKHFWCINIVFCQFYFFITCKIFREHIFENSTVRNKMSRRGEVFPSPYLKLKIFFCLSTQHKNVWESEGIVPFIFNFRATWRWLFYFILRPL